MSLSWCSVPVEDEISKQREFESFHSLTPQQFDEVWDRANDASG